MKSLGRLLLIITLWLAACCGVMSEPYGLGTHTRSLSGGWNLISLPAVPVDSAPGSVFAGIPLQGALKRWNIPTQSSIIYDSAHPGIFGNIFSAEGYWISVAPGSGFSFAGVSDNNLSDVAVSLPNTGHTVIGNPFGREFNWLDLKVTNGYKTLSIADAASAGWLQSSASSWDAVNQRTISIGLPGSASTNVLAPWQGCDVTTSAPNLALIFESEPSGNVRQSSQDRTCHYAKQRPDGTYVDLDGKIVTAVFPNDNCIYVQEPDRSSGIRVAYSGSGVAVGDTVDVTGNVSTRRPDGYTASERYVTSAVVKVASLAAGWQPRPLSMMCRSVGGAAVAPHLPGVQNGIGLNNIGLLAQIIGRVTYITETFIWVDDGANIPDIWPGPGVTVACPSTVTGIVQVGDMAVVSGIIRGSVPVGWATNRRFIQPRQWSDITIYRSSGGYGAIVGRVTDESGAPVAGARIRLSSGGFEAETAADGTYAIVGACAGVYCITVSKPGYASQTQDLIVLDDGASLTVDFAVPRQTSMISGRVYSASGSLVAGATVVLQPVGRSTKSDLDGRYAFSPVEPGTYSLTASKTDYSSVTKNNVVVQPGQTLNLDFSGMAAVSSPPRPEVYWITEPADGSTCNGSRFVNVSWQGDFHNSFQVQVTDARYPEAGPVYDSGVVASTGSSLANVGPLPFEGDLDIRVRVYNLGGWGPWSNPCRYLTRVRIIPDPQLIIRKPDSFYSFGNSSKIVIPPAATEDDVFAAQQLRKKIYAVTGRDVPILPYAPGMDLRGAIAIGQISSKGAHDNPAVEQLIATWPEAAGRARKNEGSMLGIREDSIVIAGYDSSGAFYGCQSIIQILEQVQTRPMPGMFIYDYPDIKLRGVLLRVWDWWGGYDSEFCEEVISEVVARYKMNVIEPEIRLGMRYDSAPHLLYHPTAISKAEMADLVARMKRYHIKVIAAGVSPTHADQWITNATAYKDLATTYGGSDLDIDKPATKAFLAGLLDEQFEVCQPDIIHVGGDEGSPDMSQSRYLRTIQWLYDYVYAKGCRAAIWGDMAERYNLGAMIKSTMPHMAIQDWDYNSSKTDFPSLNTWKTYGLKSWVCPYGVYVNEGIPGPYNIYYSAVSALKYGSEGLIAFNKAQLGTKSGIINSSYALDNFTQYPHYAEWGWNVGEPLGPGMRRPPLPFDGLEMFLRQLAPDRPVNQSASLKGWNVAVNWTAPNSTNCAGVRVVYRFDRYPVDIMDGYTLCDVKMGANASGTFNHYNAAGGSVYYSFFAYDDLKHFSAPSKASIQLDSSAIKNLPNGASAAFAGVVSASFKDFFYVQNPNGACGIRVNKTGHTLQVGTTVSITGTVQTNSDGERYILASDVTPSGSRPVEPAGLNAAALGGQAMGLQVGVEDGVGLNNIGLLVRVTGKIVDRQPGYVRIDGGTGRSIKCLLPAGVTVDPDWKYLCATGVSSCENVDGSIRSLVRVRAQSDLSGQ